MNVASTACGHGGVRGRTRLLIGVAGTIRGGEKDGGAARVTDGDIGFEAGAATRFFDDVRGAVEWQDVNPAETHTGWLAGVVESLFADQIRRKRIDGLSGRV